MEGPRFTFQPRSVLRLLPFFFFGLLLFLECLFWAESGGNWGIFLLLILEGKTEKQSHSHLHTLISQKGRP